MEEKVKAIIAENLNRDINEIKLDSNFRDLGADSLDTVELIMELENAFNVKISDNEMENIVTVGDAIKMIQEKTNPTQK